MYNSSSLTSSCNIGTVFAESHPHASPPLRDVQVRMYKEELIEMRKGERTDASMPKDARNDANDAQRCATINAQMNEKIANMGNDVQTIFFPLRCGYRRSPCDTAQ